MKKTTINKLKGMSTKEEQQRWIKERITNNLGSFVLIYSQGDDEIIQKVTFIFDNKKYIYSCFNDFIKIDKKIFNDVEAAIEYLIENCSKLE